MISIRRKLMARVESGETDTSPVIEYDGYVLTVGGGISPDEDCCVTKKYAYGNPSSGDYTLCYFGTFSVCCLFRDDGRYVDYWSITANQPAERKILYRNGRAELIQVTLNKTHIDSCYAYVKETGQILFAAKNSPYYGYKNIHDMPTGT